MIAGPTGPGSGGLLLWPIFGATNQLLAGLSFLVICFYLIRHGKSVWFMLLPMVLMLILPVWVLLIQIFGEGGWLEIDLDGKLKRVGLHNIHLHAHHAYEQATDHHLRLAPADGSAAEMA